ncbi:Uncharacterized protein DAT39_020583 [Clarias magur]|uniref:Uncharacterized protein n=1 Tax=Clarias magur TaxID=1594786 RepID=A0A8J4U5G9_CLAMG|nr:Uncharacterized protein DAT39_020583 [Clarias magur]
MGFLGEQHKQVATYKDILPDIICSHSLSLTISSLLNHLGLQKKAPQVPMTSYDIIMMTSTWTKGAFMESPSLSSYVAVWVIYSSPLEVSMEIKA